MQAFEFDFIFNNIEFSFVLFSFEHYNFHLFSTYFFDNITICINLPNVTLSNMSHLVYITLLGEMDGVTLSRLECIWTHLSSIQHQNLTLISLLPIPLK